VGVPLSATRARPGPGFAVGSRDAWRAGGAKSGGCGPSMRRFRGLLDRGPRSPRRRGARPRSDQDRRVARMRRGADSRCGLVGWPQDEDAPRARPPRLVACRRAAIASWIVGVCGAAASKLGLGSRFGPAMRRLSLDGARGTEDRCPAHHRDQAPARSWRERSWQGRGPPTVTRPALGPRTRRARSRESWTCRPRSSRPPRRARPPPQPGRRGRAGPHGRRRTGR